MLKDIELARQNKGLYLSDLIRTCINSFSLTRTTCNISFVIDSEIWHNRLGHISESRLILPHQLDPLIHSDFQKACDTCHLARQKSLSFPVSASATNVCFDMVHFDIWHLCQSLLYMVIYIFSPL